MALIHSVYDNDTHFKIDALTRCVKNVTETKSMLVQYDHNSERFTFEVPRYVDGHDLSRCNAVRVHYINVDKNKRTENKGVYEVTDLQVSPDADDVVICSWLISNNATQLVGSLCFVVQFCCIDESNNVVYAWNTAKHSNVAITDGIYNGDDIEREYADILQEWYIKLFEMEGGNVDLNSGEAVKFWVGTRAEFESVKDDLPEDCIVFLSDEPVVAEGAPSTDEHTNDGDEEGQVFDFSNTSGFGLRGDTTQGHFKIWSQPNSNGDSVCCLVPSKNLFMMLGAPSRIFDRVYAKEFIGTAEKAKTAIKIFPDLPSGYVNVSEYEIGEPAIYLVLLGGDNTRYSDIIFVPEWAFEDGKEVIGNYVKFSGHSANSGVLQPYNDAGNIRRVIKLSSTMAEAVG